MTKVNPSALPLPLKTPLSARPPADRLPLAFRRLWGYADEPDKPDDGQPKPPPDSLLPIAAQWGFALPQTADMGVCFNACADGGRVAAEYRAVSVELADAAACRRFTGLLLPSVANCRQAVTGDSDDLAHCAHNRISPSRPLNNCTHPHITAALSLHRCRRNPQSATGQAHGCTLPHYSADAPMSLCRSARTAPAAPLPCCFKPRYRPALPVPCGWYPVPLPELPDNADKTYVCGLRPLPSRMPLRFMRRRLQHSPDRIPLPFACHQAQTTPILRTYMIQNHISASFDDGRPLNLLGASFTADMGGYCWQGSITVPPDDFVRLGMAARAKGKEARISVHINGDHFVFIAETYSDNRAFGRRSYTVSGRSQTAYLGADYAASTGRSYPNAIYARQIADDQLADSGVRLDQWRITDWLVGADACTTGDKPPMAVLQELAAAAGGFVVSGKAKPSVSIKPRWPAAAWQLAAAKPDAVIPGSIILNISGSFKNGMLCKGVFVWGEGKDGRAGDVYRTGSGREPRAAAQSSVLYTDTDVLGAIGLAVLSDSGNHKTETVTLPVTDKYAVPPAELGEIWQVQEPTGTWQGVVTGVTLTAAVVGQAVQVTQDVTLDRYFGD